MQPKRKGTDEETELVFLDVDEVSLAAKPAIGRPFLVFKSVEGKGGDLVNQTPLTKVLEEITKSLNAVAKDRTDETARIKALETAFETMYGALVEVGSPVADKYTAKSGEDAESSASEDKESATGPATDTATPVAPASEAAKAAAKALDDLGLTPELIKNLKALGAQMGDLSAVTKSLGEIKGQVDKMAQVRGLPRAGEQDGPVTDRKSRPSSFLRAIV